MRKKLIIALCVLIALSAGYFFATRYEPAKKGEPDKPIQEAMTVYKISSTDVTSINVSNGTGAYTFVKSDNKWTLGGSDAELVDTNVSSLCYSVSYITAADSIDNSAADLSVYGLVSPSAVVTVCTAADNHTFTLGDLAPAGNYYYLADGNHVYTVSKSFGDTLLKSLNDYRNLTVVSLKTEDVRGITITGTEENLSVKYAPTEGVDNSYGSLSVWQMSSPVSCKVGNEKFGEKILTPACSISAESVVADHPSDLSKYNLTKKVTIILEDKTVSFRVGSASNVTYVLPEDGKAIFAVSADKLAFMDVKAIDIIEKFLAFEMITDVQSIDIKMPADSGVLDIRRDGDSETYYLDNDIFLNEDAFKSMYQVIIGLDADGFIQKGFDKTQSLGELTIHRTDGKTRLLKFYPYDEINAAAEVDGNTTYFIKKTKLTELESCLGKLRNAPSERVKPR